MFDNEKKGVVKAARARNCPVRCEVHAEGGDHVGEVVELSSAFKAHPRMIPTIKKYEDEINARDTMFVPMDKLAEAEPKLQSGDIVGVATTEEGIDIAHTSGAGDRG